MIRVGIIGGAGYTAGELLRILLNHPEVEIAFVQSSSNAGNPLWAVHSGLYGDTELHFCGEMPDPVGHDAVQVGQDVAPVGQEVAPVGHDAVQVGQDVAPVGHDVAPVGPDTHVIAGLTGNPSLHDVDVVFLCSGHGKSSAFWAEHPRPAGLKVIDLAQDYRDEHDGYVYGLPELQRDRIVGADLVANPGCFATAIQLALLPLAAAKLLPESVNVMAITGSTGAGVKPGATTHFSWRDNNLSVYKAFTHQHLLEIHRNLNRLQPGLGEAVNFIPVRGDFARGILAAVTVACPLSTEEATALYKDYYKDAAFTFVYPGAVDLKQVVNTNKCLLSLEAHEGKLLVTSVLDNLLKGASGAAVQNMNLCFGLPEKTGLQLKASAF